MAERMEYLEKLMGDSADKHSSELGQARDDTLRSLLHCHKMPHHSLSETLLYVIDLSSFNPFLIYKLYGKFISRTRRIQSLISFEVVSLI